MSQGTEIVRRLPTADIEVTSEQLKVLQQVLGLQLTSAEAQFMGEYCRRMNLDPFGREVHFWKSKGRIVAQVGIDALRKRAAETGEFEGEEIFYKAKGGPWLEEWEEDEPPFSAKAVVYRRGCRPFKVIVRFDEFRKVDQDGQLEGNWASKPAHMLGIRAESHSLRKAFPRETAGLYGDIEDDDGEPDRPRRPHIVNPDVKASHRQIAALQIWGQAKGLSADQRHSLASDALGVEITSFADLTKQQAADLMEAWQVFPDDRAGASASESAATAAPQAAAPSGPTVEAGGLSGPESAQRGSGPASTTVGSDDASDVGDASEGDTPPDLTETTTGAGRSTPPGTPTSQGSGVRAGTQTAPAVDLTEPEPEEADDPPAVQASSAPAEPEPAPKLEGPATEAQWENAKRVFGSKVRVLDAYMAHFKPKGKGGISSDKVTAEDLAELLLLKAQGKLPEQERL